MKGGNDKTVNLQRGQQGSSHEKTNTLALVFERSIPMPLPGLCQRVGLDIKRELFPSIERGRAVDGCGRG
jgi:hypothetical protein